MLTLDNGRFSQDKTQAGYHETPTVNPADRRDCVWDDEAMELDTVIAHKSIAERFRDMAVDLFCL